MPVLSTVRRSLSCLTRITSATALIFGKSPCGKGRDLLWVFVLVNIHPHLREFVEIAAKTKVRARTFESLRLRTRQSVWIFGPFLAAAAMGPHTRN